MLSLLRAGLAEKQIARELGLSLNTVHAYVKRIYLEYDVPSRADLLSLWASEEVWEMRDEPPRDDNSVADEIRRATLHLSRALVAAEQEGAPDRVREEIDALRTLLQTMADRARERS